MVSLKQIKDIHVFDFLLFFLGVLIKAKRPNIIIDLKIIHFDNLKDISSLNLFFFGFFFLAFGSISIEVKPLHSGFW